MPRIIEISATPAANDADGIADGNDSSGTSVDLDGVLTSGGSFTSSDGLGRIIALTDAGGHDQTTATYTIVGLDPNGHTQTESRAGPGSSATVYFTGYYSAVTEITISSPTASSTIDIGTKANETASKTITVDYHSDPYIGLGCAVTGTIDYTVQHCFRDNLKAGNTQTTYFDHADMAGKTANDDGNYAAKVSGIRMTTNSYTAGATYTLWIVQ